MRKCLNLLATTLFGGCWRVALFFESLWSIPDRRSVEGKRFDLATVSLYGAHAIAAEPDPLHFQRHIICAPIAEALHLRWWEPDYKYWTRVLNVELTVQDYVSRYVEFRRERLRESAAA